MSQKHIRLRTLTTTSHSEKRMGVFALMSGPKDELRYVPSHRWSRRNRNVNELRSLWDVRKWNLRGCYDGSAATLVSDIEHTRPHSFRVANLRGRGVMTFPKRLQRVWTSGKGRIYSLNDITNIYGQNSNPLSYTVYREIGSDTLYMHPFYAELIVARPEGNSRSTIH